MKKFYGNKKIPINARQVKTALIVFTIAGGASLVLKQFILVLIAVINFSSLDSEGNVRQEYELKTHAQKHFGGYSIYIPQEDIHTIRDVYAKQLIKRCGEGNVYIWVPLELDFFWFGKRIFEWCVALK